MQVMRPWVAHPLAPILNILSIAVGVVVFLAIQLANRGALESFQNAVSLVAGKAHLEIRGDLPEEIFPSVLKVKGVASATPLVEGIVTLPEHAGEYLRILGVDPFTGAEIRAFELTDPRGGAPDLEAWLREPLGIAISSDALFDDKVSVLSPSGIHTLKPVFLMKTSDAIVSSDPRMAAMDIGWAQQLLGSQGKISSIQLLLDNPLEVNSVTKLLREILPADAVIGPPARRGAETETMLAAFQLNLTALSLVSMVVGVFLIYNSLSASVVRRRHDIGILRSIGGTRLEVTALFLGEGLVCGFIGTLLGIAGAGPLAALLASPVEQTVTSLYTVVAIDSPTPDLDQTALAFLLGMGASLIAAWRPAAEAAECDPAVVLRSGTAMDRFARFSFYRDLAGVLALGCAFGLSLWALRGGGGFPGFAAVAFLIAGFSLLVPRVSVALCGLLHGFGWLPKMAAQHLVRSLHRNAVTIASLAVAAALTVSVSVMIFSFRASVEAWLGRTLAADLYIAPAANDLIGLQYFLPANTLDWVRQDSRVDRVGTFREIQVPWGDRAANLAIVDGGARGDLEFLEGGDKAASLFEREGMVAVSESFSNRHGVRSGDRLSFVSPVGPADFVVAGVIRDFTRDRGLVMVTRQNFDRFWNDARLHSLSISMKEGTDLKAFSDDFRAHFSGAGEYSIYTNALLRGRVLEIFDQTFAVTSVLRSVAIVVAIAGVLLSMTTLVLEREREIGVLRSQGASRRQVTGLVFFEAGLVGGLASLVGLVCGVFLSAILTGVVNKAFFGWTIDLRFPAEVFLSTPLWLIPAALVAAWIPAWRAANIPPARALRFE
jgi:putative ABC transport system permease protein